MDCLRYLLNLHSDGHKFTIYYNSDHCFGVSEIKLFDFNNQFKKDFLQGLCDMYLPLTTCHEKETVKKIFNLDERYSKLIDEYYASR